MTVKELVSLLSKQEQDDEILIKILVPGRIGTSYTKVSGVIRGFDWDANKVFLIPELHLLRYDREER